MEEDHIERYIYLAQNFIEFFSVNNDINWVVFKLNISITLFQWIWLLNLFIFIILYYVNYF